MDIIFLLVIVSLVFVSVIAITLFWAIRSGQFDDMEKQGSQIIMDEEKIIPEEKE